MTTFCLCLTTKLSLYLLARCEERAKISIDCSRRSWAGDFKAWFVKLYCAIAQNLSLLLFSFLSDICVLHIHVSLRLLWRKFSFAVSSSQWLHFSLSASLYMRLPLKWRVDHQKWIVMKGVYTAEPCTGTCLLLKQLLKGSTNCQIRVLEWHLSKTGLGESTNGCLMCLLNDGLVFSRLDADMFCKLLMSFA